MKQKFKSGKNWLNWKIIAFSLFLSILIILLVLHSADKPKQVELEWNQITGQNIMFDTELSRSKLVEFRWKGEDYVASNIETYIDPTYGAEVKERDFYITKDNQTITQGGNLHDFSIFDCGEKFCVFGIQLTAAPMYRNFKGVSIDNDMVVILGMPVMKLQLSNPCERHRLEAYNIEQKNQTGFLIQVKCLRYETQSGGVKDIVEYYEGFLDVSHIA